ncbi:MAG: DnaJ domain-containing protein [bacterium]|nr:DnaJ domain-containing protein [bacterium]MDT8396192.1 DnaJ domain-containing protein [bacterium]
MQVAARTSRKINYALRLLYGEQHQPPALLESLQLDELKSTFRRRAMELHPDRANLLGRDPVDLNERFRDVKLAYETLRELLTAGQIPLTMITHQEWSTQPADPPPPGPGHCAGTHHQEPDTEEHSKKGASPSDHYWEADIPASRLLFGQFLYYAGLVSWQTLISAITWQRRQRPPFGRIAKMWDYLTDEEIRQIIDFRTPGERIGEAALRHGYLSRFQFSAVMGFQKWMQRPIGEYFQEIGILEDEEIQYLVGLLKKHNRRVERGIWVQGSGFRLD